MRLGQAGRARHELLEGLVHRCITDIRQRNLSTNEGYRATFTKAQVGRESGAETPGGRQLEQMCARPRCRARGERSDSVGPALGRVVPGRAV